MTPIRTAADGLPCLDLRAGNGHELLRALTTAGACHLLAHGLEATAARARHAAAAFFALPDHDRRAIHIDRSPHARGWSTMHNERDHREQLHIGRELAAGSDDGAGGLLQGPNLWPAALPELRGALLDLLDDAARLGHRLLASIGAALVLPPDTLATDHQEPDYSLLKAICYHPQPADRPWRGVAAHCDWSWLTLVTQDRTGGLEIRTPDGVWRPVAPLPDALFLNVGEVLQIVTGGRLQATPHRVCNPSHTVSRLSLPVFVNPPRQAMVARAAAFPFEGRTDLADDHVHRVQPPHLDPPPFRYGASEWDRKGVGRWCWRPACTRLSG
ncbi:MAG: isopenicillin N synthase family oxygenase [Planctomycetes bacterium]|nr:isopenicillin N synthase family oxygenase [Planctomycetota bacterium]